MSKSGKPSAAPDLLFALTYAAIPFIAEAAGRSASFFPQIHLRIGILNLFVYPMTCAAMIHLAASRKEIREGALFLKGALWTSFSWPAGILFWITLFFHSVWMTMSFAWGELVAGTDIYLLAGAGDCAAMTGGWIFFFFSSVFIAASLAGIDGRKLKKFLEPWIPRRRNGKGMFAFQTAVLVLAGPVFLLILSALIMVIPFYLYCIVWWYIFRSSDDKKKRTLPFRDIPVPEFSVTVLLYLYSAIMAFFFDAGVSHMVSISRGPGEYMPFWLAAAFAMGLFYIPYRTFFALGRGRSIVSWVIFTAGIAVVFIETYRRFQL